MTSKLRGQWLVWGMCLGMVACDPGWGGPAGPESLSLRLDAAPSYRQNVAGGIATGHGFIHGTTLENIADEQYSLSAVSKGDFPKAHGQVQAKFVNFQGAEFKVHAEVTCLAIVGDHAWVGSRVVSATRDGEVFPILLGRPMTFHFTDEGESGDSVDTASLLFFGYGDDLAYCHDRPDFPVLYPSVSGNFQVLPT